MAIRPAFQFYPAEWRGNAKLRRCSLEARGAWMEVLCLLHDSDEYGVLRWPLADIAQAAGVPLKLLRELATKSVLKGADANAPAFVYTPRHGGRDGDPVTLLAATDEPCWYCSRFVRDEYVRMRRGTATQFTSDNQPKATPKGGIGDGTGARQGDGASSSSSSSTSKSEEATPPQTADAVSFEAVVEVYHSSLPSCRRVSALTPKRQKAFRTVEKIAKRLCRERGWDYGPDFWRDYFAECAKDPWYRGDVPYANDPAWKQNLETLLREDHFAKIMDRALENTP